MSCKRPFASSRRAWILALGVACGTFPAPLAAAPSYVFHTWQAGDGLPQNAVTAVVQTRDGYIWVGTYSGLARFDGVRFVNFYDGNTAEMRSSRVTCLFEAGDGTLWIGHEGGEVTRFKDGRFQAVPSRANWSAGAVLSIGEDEAGDIWLVNPEGLLSRLKDGLKLSPRVGSTRGMVNVARGSRERLRCRTCARWSRTAKARCGLGCWAAASAASRTA